MDFAQAILSVLTKYATFSGRAIRSEYWYFVLFSVLLNIGANIIDTTILGAGMGQFGLFSSFLSIALFIPNIAVTIRRLHDLDKSGWWVFLMLIPMIGFIVLLIWLTMKGTNGPNNFGSDYFEHVGNFEDGQLHRSSIPTVSRKD